MFISRREFNEIKRKVVVYRDTNYNLQLENETLRIALDMKGESIKNKVVNQESEMKEEEADLSIKNTGTLERIRKVEEEIAQIHKRYEKIEGLFQEKELSVKLQKLEQQKWTEQKKLKLLEARLKKWNAEEVKVNSGILR
jgi:hypothetical protein